MVKQLPVPCQGMEMLVLVLESVPVPLLEPSPVLQIVALVALVLVLVLVLVLPVVPVVPVVPEPAQAPALEASIVGLPMVLQVLPVERRQMTQLRGIRRTQRR